MAGTSYDIRPAEADDSTAIEELWVALHEEQREIDARSGLSDDARERWENDFPVWLEDDDCCLLTAVAGEEVVGFLHAERWYPPPTELPSSDAYVNSLYVRPEHRQQGIGSRLVAAVKDWAETQELDRLRFGVLHANETGRQFWQEQGAAEFIDIMTMDVA